MANTIKIRRSATPGATPTTGQLALGELALNTYDGKLYTKKDNGSESIVELSGGGGGGQNYTYSSSAPVSPTAGDEWLDSDTGILYTYVNDGDSSAWVELGPNGGWGSNVDIPGTLDVTGATTLDSTLSFPLGSASAPSLYPGTDTNTGFWSPAADALAISTAGSEAVRLDSSGRLLVGTSTAPSAGTAQHCKLVSLGNTAFSGSFGGLALARAAAATSITAGQSIGIISFADQSGNSFAEIECFADAAAGTNDYPGRLVFSTTADAASSPIEALRITSDKYLRMAASTGGIQFNGDTASANALDDYEEGTWTPTVIGSSTAGSASYAERAGSYTKIGRLVVFSCYINWSSGTGTGELRISGLPFTSASDNTYFQFSVRANNIALNAGNYPEAGILDNSSTVIGMYQYPTGGGAGSNVAYDAAAEMAIVGTYFV